nr:hypothetical protein [Parendozoicomonas sp. Alg238-R29]
MRFNEADADPTATTFNWEMFLLAGDRSGATLADGGVIGT